MLSKSSKYGIRAVLYIARNASPTKKIGSREIAETLDIPAPFLAKTLQGLSRKGIISSAKGPGGGFYLTEKNTRKSIFDIIESIDGFQRFEGCFIGHPECDDSQPCIVHHLYAPFKEELIRCLAQKTIEEMVHENSIERIINLTN